MKLKMYFIMLALGLFSFAMQSCDDDDEDAPVSEQLEKAFINEFGNVAIIGLRGVLIMLHLSIKTIQKKKPGLMQMEFG